MASQPAISAVAIDLISFLKALTDCRIRRGICFPQLWMLLVAILSILSGQGSLVGMVRLAKRRRQTLNELLGTDFSKSPSDSTSGCYSPSWISPTLMGCSKMDGCPDRCCQERRHPGV